MKRFYSLHFLYFLIVFMSTKILAQDSLKVQRNYLFVWGTNPNINALSLDVHSTSSFMFERLNYAIASSSSKYINNGFVRFLNLGFQGSIGTWIFITIPHETAHYLRGKESGLEDVKVHLEAKFFGGYYTVNTKLNENTPIERLMVTTAGPELTTLISYHQVKDMYSGKPIPPHYSIFQIGAKFVDGYNYYSRVKDFQEDPNKWLNEKKENFSNDRSPLKFDPIGFTLTLAENYGYYDSWLPKDSIWFWEPDDISLYNNEFVADQFKRMKNAYLLALFDPSIINSLFCAIKYIIYGDLYSDVYMIPIGRLKFMPSIRANMGMWGIENYFDLHFLYDHKLPISMYYRHGGNLNENIYGFGSEISNLKVFDHVNLNLEVDYWKNDGFNISTEMQYKYKRIILLANLSYKTYGSLIGKPWGKGMYGYGGIGINFEYSK